MRKQKIITQKDINQALTRKAFLPTFCLDFRMSKRPDNTLAESLKLNIFYNLQFINISFEISTNFDSEFETFALNFINKFNFANVLGEIKALRSK